MARQEKFVLFYLGFTNTGIEPLTARVNGTFAPLHRNGRPKQ